MRYFSTFTGIGGFELAIEQAFRSFYKRRVIIRGSASYRKPQCIGFSEIDKYAAQIYQQHYPSHKNYGDITKINEKELPDFDLLIGGFPCQSFSIAGKRRGFADTRGTLFFDICRIIKQKQPRLVLLENVKGLLSHEGGKTFTTIIAALDDLGYDCQWQVLNSKNFGVPQNRERVFIVGHIRGTPRPEVFPFGENDQVSFETRESKERQSQTEISPTLKGAQVKADNAFIVEDQRALPPPPPADTGSDKTRVRGSGNRRQHKSIRHEQ